MWEMTQKPGDSDCYQPTVLLHFSLLTRINDETYFEWMARYKVMHKRDPRPREFVLAPFPKVSMAVCQTKEKFQWCLENVGVFNFHELITDTAKIWLFNHEADAAIFKLRWLGINENQKHDKL